METETRLNRQKEAIRQLVKQMINNLPTMAQTMIMCYRGTIDSMIDNLTSEQIEHVLTEAKAVIHALECDNE